MNIFAHLIKHFAASYDSSDMENVSILICEDEPIVARDIQMCLLQKGYKVVGIANNGVSALELTKEFHPDLVLMDVNLNGKIEGTLVAEALNSQFQIPSIFLTAYADEKTLDAAKRANPIGYLLKPYNSQELYTTIETGVNRLRSQKEIIEKIKKTVVIPDPETNLNTAAQSNLVSEYFHSKSSYSMRHVIGNIVEHVSGDLFIISQQIQRIAALNDSSQEILRACRVAMLHQEYLKNFVKSLYEISDHNISHGQELCFLSDVIEESIKEFSAPKIKIIDFNIEPALTKDQKIYVTPSELKKSIVNILANAYEASDGKPVVDISITTECIHEPESFNAEAKPGVFYGIEIRDYGIGIAKGNLKLVRQPLYSNWSKEQCETRFGMGLAYADNVVQRHGGWMAIDSSADEGTIIKLYLPKAK